MMGLKGSIFLLLLVALVNAVASQGSCGAPYQGEFLEDFHGGHSYVSYTIDEKYLKENYLSYQDRFCSKNGSGIIDILTSRKQGEDIVIEVSQGNVVAHLMKNHNAEPECMFTLSKKVIDGSSHLFAIEFKEKEFTMTLFRRYTKIYSLNVADISSCLEGKFSTFTILEKGGQKIGVVPFAKGTEDELVALKGKPHLQNDFDGCIGDSLLNGIPISKAGRQIEEYDIDPTCSHSFGPECTDVCATSYIAQGDKCVCPSDSEINDFGICVKSCNCFTCQNGGKCTPKSGSDAACECPPDYTGKYCETKFDRCLGFDCQNGGSCIVQPNGPSCICLPDFTGTQCEVFIPPPENPCKDVHCQNNGTCEINTTLEEKYFCSCLPGYDGKMCESHRKSDAQLTEGQIDGIIGGAVVGGCVIVGLTVALIVYLVRKYRSMEKTPPRILTAD